MSKTNVFLCLIVLVPFLSTTGSLSYADDSVVTTNGLQWLSNERSIDLYDGDKLIFKFNYAFVDHKEFGVPEKETRRYAGDYIYPLYGVCGENLLDNAPLDHYHHHGVFWTWPGVFTHQEDGTVKAYDLWTSNTKIRQRFLNVDFLEVKGDVARMLVVNGWFVDGESTTPDEKLDLSKRGFSIADNKKYYGEQIAEERMLVTVRREENVEGIRSRSIDFELTLIPTTKPISLQGAEKKSYGGFTIRFRPQGEIGVDRFITTDEGVAKDDMPEKPLRWADYTSRFNNNGDADSSNTELSGAAIFLSPDFPDFPPTWLTRYYGPLCVGFPGVESRRFEVGEPIVMKARVWMHEGLVAPELLKRIYEKYASE